MAMTKEQILERQRRYCQEHPEEIERAREANSRSLEATAEHQRRYWQEHPEELERHIRAESKRLAKAELRDMMENDPETVVAALQPRRPRKPGVATLIARAERKGKTVTSVTASDGTVLHFGEPQPTEAANPWLVDIDKVTKQ